MDSTDRDPEVSLNTALNSHDGISGILKGFKDDIESMSGDAGGVRRAAMRAECHKAALVMFVIQQMCGVGLAAIDQWLKLEERATEGERWRTRDTSQSST